MEKSINPESMRDGWDSGFFIKERGQQDFSLYRTSKNPWSQDLGRVTLAGEDEVAKNQREPGRGFQRLERTKEGRL